MSKVNRCQIISMELDADDSAVMVRVLKNAMINDCIVLKSAKRTGRDIKTRVRMLDESKRMYELVSGKSAEEEIEKFFSFERKRNSF